MQAAFDKLSQRVGKPLGLRFHEPPGQNGYDCLLLAGLDQVSDLGFELDLSATQLRGLVKTFLREWKTLVLDSDWQQRDCGRSDDLTMLSDAGSDYTEFLNDPKAVGTQAVLLALVGVLSQITHARIQANVRALPAGGERGARSAACEAHRRHMSTPAADRRRRSTHMGGTLREAKGQRVSISMRDCIVISSSDQVFSTLGGCQ